MFLRQKSNRSRFFEGDFTFVGRCLAQNQREQRRLSRAVGPDQTHPIATIYLERRLFKKNASGKSSGDLRHREHASGGESRESKRPRKPSIGSTEPRLPS